MSEEKEFKIDIPESIESYKVTLFWGLGLKQIVLVFAACLFMGLGVFNVFSGQFALTALMLLACAALLLGILEIRGRNFYRHLIFILTYYQTKPKVYIYDHISQSAKVAFQRQQLVYQKESNFKIYLAIAISIITGFVLLTLTGIYIYHVIHK